MFEKILNAGWGDMDFNSHMRNTAFLDKAADVRMMFFAEHGFPMAELHRQRIGPVIRKDELEYFREIHLLEPIRVALAVDALADDGSRFVFRNEFWRDDAQLAATVTSRGGWLDLVRRKLVAPPTALRDALHTLPRSTDFHVLPSNVKRGSEDPTD